MLSSYLTDDDYADFQWYLALYSKSEDIIPGSGGLRKIRWMAKGRG
ncbi:MAG: hypothetical protein LN561_01150 [Rickettsia endosymbiont of Labidopullus appendiculatus]|nr:hypothetical protein [Rickettsia endosymbiont of Labidopullus appendiculatus]